MVSASVPSGTQWRLRSQRAQAFSAPWRWSSVLSAVAVVTESSPPASPCGACRQVLAEFGEFPVILANLAGDRIVTSVGDLLPNAFTPDVLVKS